MISPKKRSYKKAIPLKKIREHYVYLKEHLDDMYEKNQFLFERIGNTLDNIQKQITENQVGIANVYDALIKRIDKLEKKK